MKVCPRFPALLAALMLAGQATGQADTNATVSGTINYVGPVTGPVVVWAFENGQKVTALTLPNGPGPYSMQLPMNRNYDIKAFRDGDTDGELDHGWQVGEPYAHHGDWNSTSSSFNTFLLDGNKTGIDVNISWHNDSDGDGFYDWDEYVAGSEGNDSSSVPGIGYGLIAHWTFDETNGTVLGGSSANEINGTLVGFGSNSSAHWVPGKTGGSLRFDGVDDYVSFPGASPLDDLRPFSFAGWIKLDQNGSGYVLAKRSLVSGYWRFFASGPTKNWLIRQTTGTAPSLATTEVTPFFQWQHVALTWNGLLGAQNSSIYLDGTLVSNITQTSGSGELTSDVGNLFTLGNRPQNNSSFFKGWMDDFRIWNRVLLPHEVNTLHQGPSFPLTDANFTQAIDLWFSDQASAAATYGHIRDWNVSGVTNMANAFQDRTTFNEDISSWNTSAVTTMNSIFRNASSFNQNVGDWDTSAVTNMFNMFQGATAFNQDIGDWNTSAVTTLRTSFTNASSFNHDIGDWDTSKVTNMGSTFYGSTSFNQDIGNWNTSAVKTMNSIFRDASAFNQDIGDWNTSAVTNMANMFQGASSLSDVNKGLIHHSFSTNSNWPYDWSAYADVNVTLSGTVSYSGPVTGPVVVWAFENGQKVAEITLTNGPGPYSLQLPKNRNYDVKAFRDGNGNGNLDAGWQVGEPYAHHGDWNSTSSSFNSLLLDGNKTGIDVNISWHNDTDNDGFHDWDEYVAGSEGNDSNSTPGLNFGLVAWYPFDGNASDMSGNGNHGTVHGATLGQDRHGMSGLHAGALTFNAANHQYAEIPNAPQFSFDQGNFTTAMWLRGDSQPRVSTPFIKASNPNLPYEGITLFLDHGKVRGRTTHYAELVSIRSDLDSLQWHHVLMSRKGTALTIYVDGIFDSTRVDPLTNLTNSAPIVLGANHVNRQSQNFNGAIDEIRIYNRALSASEVQSLYLMESTPPADNNQTTPSSDNNATNPPVDVNYTNPPTDINGTVIPPPVENNQTDPNQNASAPVTGDPATSLFRPYPRTLPREELKDGNFRFWGQILTDGGSPITEVAFELADNMLFRNSTLRPASLFPGSPNFYLELKLEPGKRYYYRAVATNAVGTTFGSAKRLTTPGDSMYWWSDTVLTQGGWRTSPWFGTFRRHEGTEWIYHAQLGWAYAHPDGSGGLWLWFRDHHWTWTQSGAFPYLWKHDLGGWLYLLGSQNGKPSFYHYESGSIR